MKGGKSVTVDAPISQMPVHVRAGSIIPMGPIVSHASLQADAPVELRVYPGANGEYTYYEDAGEGWGYERGEYSLTKMRWNDASGTLAIEPRQGAFPGMRAKRQLKIVIVGPGNGVSVDAGRKVFDVVYDGSAMTVHTPER